MNNIKQKQKHVKLGTVEEVNLREENIEMIEMNRAGTLDLSKDQSGVFRVMVWNVQLALLQQLKADLIISEIEAIKPSVVLIQEPGPAGIHRNEEVREMFRAFSDLTKVVTSSNRIVNNGWQYGGVLSVVFNDWIHKIDAILHDPKIAGRYHAVRLRGKLGKKYTLFNIYRPHFLSSGQGAAALQTILLNEYYPSGKSTKEVWIDDLFHLIDQELSSGNEVMIAGDFNLETKERDILFDEIRARDMINCMEHLYGQALPPTREPYVTSNSKSPIDHIYVTKGFILKEGCIGPFQLGSDHSYLVMDFFSEPMFHLQKCNPPARGRTIHSSKPNLIPKYRRRLDEGIKEKGMIDTLESLLQRVKDDKIDEGDQRKFSDIVADLDALTMNSSNNLTARYKRGKLLDKNRQVIVWRQIIRWIKNPIQKKAVIKRKLKSIGENECILKSLTIDQARQRLTYAWQEYYANPDKKWNNRQRRLRRQAEGLHDLDPSRTIEQHQEQIRQMKDIKISHTKIKIARGKTKGAGVYMLEKTVGGDKVLLTEKDQIEREALIECNNKVHAADVTPLKQEPLREYLGVESNIDRWEEWVQRRSFNFPLEIEETMDEGIKLFLNKVIQEKTEDMDFNISPDEYHSSWRKQNENTSSAPGINFSHMMCITPDSLANKARALITNIRLRTGWNPECYLKATDSLLMKKKDNFTVKGMRLITLQHCACNHDNKLIGKWINSQGEKTKKFAIEQAGCRNRMRANEQALNKALSADFARGFRCPMAIIANDAKGCFDRIVLFAAFLVLRWLGIPFTVVKAMLDSILNMSHTVKTVYGESEQTYGGELTYPNGFCQGNGMAGQGFTALSSPLLDICKEKGYGADFPELLSGEVHCIAGTMFVDDFDAMITPKAGEGNQQFVQRTQEYISLWNNLLRATGGALEPTKTHWCNFAYKKIRGKWKPMECDGELEIEDENSGQLVKLEKIAVNDARRTLGVYLAIDGSQTTHLEYLLDTIRIFALKMKGSFLTQREKMIALKTTITRTIEYGTTASYLSETQANQVTKELRKAVLNGLGFSRSMPCEIVHGPREYNGIEVMDYDVSQGAEHIRVLLDHWGKDTQTGRLLQVNTQLYDLIVGTSSGFWATNDVKLIRLVPDSWLRNTRLFMIRNGVDISIKRKSLQLWRGNDRLLMDMVKECVGWTFSEKELIDFNEVRMTLRVTTLSDIIANRRLIPGIWNASIQPSSVSSRRYEWPKSGNLTRTEIENWQLVLMKLGLEENIEITHSLGGWYADTIEYLALSNAQQDAVQIWNGYSKETFKIVDHHRRHKHFQLTELQMQYDDGEIFSFYREADSIVLLEACDMIIRPLEAEGCDWTQPMVLGNETAERRFVHKLVMGQAKLVTDASDNKHNVLTAAFTEEVPLEAETLDILQGSIQIPAAMGQANSFRGELGGILAVISYVNRLAMKYNIRRGRCTISCDNIGSIERARQATDATFVFQARMNSFDLLRILQKKIVSSPITYDFSHVYGHQDNGREYAELNDDARANIRADILAKEMAKDKVPMPQPFRLQEEEIVCYINGNKLHGKILGTIWSSKYRQQLIDYWRRKGRFNSSIGVDWGVVEQANKKLPPNEWKMITKLLSGWTGTAEKMHQRGEYTTATCPICNRLKEDRRHLWRCQDDRVNWKLMQEMNALEKLLQKPMFEPNLFPAVEALIDMYRYESDTFMRRLSERNKNIVNAQQSIGPNSFVEGILHEEWKKHCGGATGVIILIRRIYKIWIVLWKHRNEVLKGGGKDWKTVENLRESILRLMEDTPSRLVGADKEHFHIEVEQLCRRPIDEQRYWIRGARAIIKKVNRIRSRGMLQYTNELIPLDSEKRKELRRQHMVRRKKERETEIRKMIRWRPSSLTQDEQRILLKGETVLQQDEWIQLRWLRQMQKVRKHYNDRWQSRNNLGAWRLDMTRNNTKEVDARNNTKVADEKIRKQSKITKWLNRESNGRG